MIRVIGLAGLFLLLCEDAMFCRMPEPSIVTIQSAPERPIIELCSGTQLLNLDLIVRNESRLTLRMSQLEVSFFDRTHWLVRGSRSTRASHIDPIRALRERVTSVCYQNLGPTESNRPTTLTIRIGFESAWPCWLF
jgi:hypothetical protein